MCTVESSNACTWKTAILIDVLKTLLIMLIFVLCLVIDMSNELFSWVVGGWK